MGASRPPQKPNTMCSRQLPFGDIAGPTARDSAHKAIFHPPEWTPSRAGGVELGVWKARSPNAGCRRRERRGRSPAARSGHPQEQPLPGSPAPWECRRVAEGSRWAKCVPQYQRLLPTPQNLVTMVYTTSYPTDTSIRPRCHASLGREACGRPQQSSAPVLKGCPPRRKLAPPPPSSMRCFPSGLS